jgi:putative FmdB family regulatory protein
MPMYDYECSKCKKRFEQFRTIENRDSPCNESCPYCGKKKCVTRIYIEAPLTGADSKLSPGSDFNAVIKRIAAGVPKRYREGLERSTSLRGTRYEVPKKKR